MDLNFFDKLKDSTKESDGIQEVLDSLREFLENKIPELEVSERNSVSLIQRLQEHGKVTTAFRDKMLVERSNLLNNYAKETLEKGSMYYIYSKNSSKENAFNLCICEEGMSNKVITVEESDLPDGVGVDSILRLEDGKYVFDVKATEFISNEMQKMTEKLLEDQNLELSQKRVEGNTYEVVDISGDSAWIMNVTKDDGDCFEEIGISKAVLSELHAGDLIQYVNGEYITSLKETK